MSTTARRTKGRQNGTATITPAKRVGCYARISVADRDGSEFSSIQAQTEAVLAYVTSQQSNGWKLAGDPYVDDGYSGGTTERPALRRLLDDVRAGLLDMVVVHRFDRFSRSQRDFLNLMHVLEEHGVGFASVSQSLDTSTAIGRCMLGVLLSFAQMERETIAERTRDKVRAARRKGLWTGGVPRLGYDLVDGALVVNADEAERVREIFRLYLNEGGLIPLARELSARGWSNKRWTNKRGEVCGGGRFTKSSLHHLLRCPLYVGLVRCGDEVHEGQHEAIVDRATWDAVQEALARPAARRTRPRGVKQGALLAGLLTCGRCGSGLHYHYAMRHGRRYAYYVCLRASKEGADACPGSRVAAGEIEGFVLDRIREIGRDPEVLAATLDAERRYREEREPELRERVTRLRAERGRMVSERDALVEAIATGKAAARKALTKALGEVEERIADVERQLALAEYEATTLDAGAVDPEELRRALADLEPVWAVLSTEERARILDLLIAGVVLDPDAGEVEIAFRPGGPKRLGGMR